MTAPAMAPAGADFLCSVELSETFEHIVDAQESHEEAISVQVSSEAQEGHDGVSEGH